jgi:hypothetical protein
VTGPDLDGAGASGLKRTGHLTGHSESNKSVFEWRGNNKSNIDTRQDLEYMSCNPIVAVALMGYFLVQ